jgi:uncharacterized protein (TIGR00255 family)
MTLSSMTGFARVTGQLDGSSWSWELKSVNAKGFDLRLRLPPGLDGVESEVRRMLGTVIGRGTVNIALDLNHAAKTPDIKINEALVKVLAEKLSRAARDAGLQPPSMDAILSLRGVVELVEEPECQLVRDALAAAILLSFEDAVVSLCATRQSEGAALKAILLARIDDINALIDQADQLPSRSANAVKARLSKQIEDLLSGSGDQFDPQRLHQEAMLMAIKADIREELDRLVSHVSQTRDLIARGGPIGRRLDFMAQEFSRETNTLCAKSNDVALTRIGIDLKTLVEQFREQVQNVE